MIFGAKIPYFANQPVQIQVKKTQQIYFATVSYCQNFVLRQISTSARFRVGQGI